MPGYRELTPEELRFSLDETTLGFDTTETVEPLTGSIGQERALRSLNFGLGIRNSGYNIYVMGQPGTGKLSTVTNALEARAKVGPQPKDWLYLMDFKAPDKPVAVDLPRGKGCELKSDMDNIVEQLKKAIPKRFESEDYEKKRQEIYTEHNRETSALFEELGADAKTKGFSLEKSPRGLMLVPLKEDGSLMTQEEFEASPQEAKDKIEATGTVLQERLNDAIRKAREKEKELQERLKEANREFGLYAVGHFMDELREKYADYPKLTTYFDLFMEDVLERLEDFKSDSQQGQPANPFMQRPEVSFDRYKANLLVDNCNASGTPVVFEPNPTYPNLFGRVEQKVQFGVVTTDFTMIKAGALHRANGGYLVLNALDLLRSPFAYEGLKRALKNKKLVIEDAMEAYRMVPIYTMKPEPIPLDIKVILIGPPMIYYLLHSQDDEYGKLFKARADFDSRMVMTKDAVDAYAGFIATRCKEEGMLPFDRSGVARVVEYSARLVSDKEKLSAKFMQVADMVREASYWAAEAGADKVLREHVETAIKEQTYRSGMYEERLRQAMAEGIIKVDLEGEVAGQVNGLSVLSLGDYSFGRPSRITARVYMGRAGMVNIEREVKMSGPIHDKGVMILTGYLGDKYAQDKPLTVSASIAFEQSYEGIEGDSASSTELYALLSALSGLPIRQGIAVTGSVNQRGEVQAIGGVNEKVEGYFEVCRQHGLNGRQGVMVPDSNVRHLMLNEEVVQAVIDGKFHIWAIADIDSGIEALTGVPAGVKGPDGKYPEGTVNRLVDDRLATMAKGLKEFGEKKSTDKKPKADAAPAACKRLLRHMKLRGGQNINPAT